MNKFLRKIRRAFFNKDASFCDMYADAGSRQQGDEYLTLIRPHLRDQFGDRPLTILDAGCQAGRLLVPLGQDGHRMIGLDTSGFALRRAREHVRAAHVQAELRRGGIGSLRRWVTPASLDAVVCTEVLYLCQDYRHLLHLLVESVKPEGLLFVSHRPTSYYVAVALGRNDLGHALSLAERTEGASTDGSYHNWHTPEQVHELYRSFGLQVLGCHPIYRQKREGITPPPSAPQLARILEPTRENSTYRIPTYLLAIAQKIGTSSG